jgi:two-component system LytT family response regulator
MPKLTGMEVLELIDKKPLVVFVTAYDEFAVKAFEMNAVDYLLKPYSKQRFAEMLVKLKEKLLLQSSNEKKYEKLQDSIAQNQTISRIAVKTGSKIDVLLVENIVMFEAQDDYVQIYTEKNKYLKNLKMKQLEENLPKNKFLRIHRSFIVNTVL